MLGLGKYLENCIGNVEKQTNKERFSFFVK